MAPWSLKCGPDGSRCDSGRARLRRVKRTKNTMFVVTDESELNWWARRFAPRIWLRLSPGVVELASAEGVARSSALLAVIRDGDYTFVAEIDDDRVAEGLADRVVAFRVPGEVLSTMDAAVRFLRLLMRQLPKSGGVTRPVVIVEGLPYLEDVLDGHQRAIVIRALATCGAAAAVIADVSGSEE